MTVYVDFVELSMVERLLILAVKMIPGAVLIYLAVGCFFVIKQNILQKAFLLVSCSLLSAMVIQMSDWLNILATLTVFMAAVWLGCEGSTLKRIAVALMFANTVLAFNALMDNFAESSQGGVIIGRLLFGGSLYFLCRHFSPGKELELAPAMWRLLLLLTATPLGIILSVVLLTYYGEKRDSYQYLILLLLALSLLPGFCGRLRCWPGRESWRRHR